MKLCNRIYKPSSLPCPVLVVNSVNFTGHNQRSFDSLFSTGGWFSVLKLTHTVAGIILPGMSHQSLSEIEMGTVVAIIRRDRFEQGRPSSEEVVKQITRSYDNFIKTFEWETSILNLLEPVVPSPQPTPDPLPEVTPEELLPEQA